MQRDTGVRRKGSKRKGGSVMKDGGACDRVERPRFASETVG